MTPSRPELVIRRTSAFALGDAEWRGMDLDILGLVLEVALHHFIEVMLQPVRTALKDSRTPNNEVIGRWMCAGFIQVKQVHGSTVPSRDLKRAALWPPAYAEKKSLEGSRLGEKPYRPTVPEQSCQLRRSSKADPRLSSGLGTPLE